MDDYNFLLEESIKALANYVKSKEVSQPARIFYAPEDDVRLTANIKKELHLKLKIYAANERTTAGEVIEMLIERYLP